MPSENESGPDCGKRMIIIHDGPYVIEGDVPLVEKIQVVSEFGEPLTWQKIGDIETSPEQYALCRCGCSSVKPFCDGTHKKAGFDGTETAFVTTTARRALKLPNSTRMIVKRDPTLCMNSGFCGLRDANITRLVAATQETRTRSLVMAMIERCPSGALTYRIEADGPDIEPDLPQQIAVTIEITSDGPIAGPLWVTGGIAVTRSDGKPFENRNRVTLCNCGHSDNKPLCNGTHRRMAEQAARARRESETK